MELRRRLERLAGTDSSVGDAVPSSTAGGEEAPDPTAPEADASDVVGAGGGGGGGTAIGAGSGGGDAGVGTGGGGVSAGVGAAGCGALGGLGVFAGEVAGGSGTNSPGRQVCGCRSTDGSFTNRSAWPHCRQMRVPSDSSPPRRRLSSPRPIVPVLRSFAHTKSLAPQLLHVGATELHLPCESRPALD